MNENQTLGNEFSEDAVNPILPDDFKEGYELFPQGHTFEDDTDPFDEARQDPADVDQTEPAETKAEPPATEEKAEGSDQSVGKATEETKPDGAEPAPEAAPRTIQYRRNHEDKEFDPFADPAVTKDLLECGFAYKARQEKDNQEAYINTLNRMVKDGESIEIAEMAAERAAHGKSYDYEKGADDKYQLSAEQTSKPEHVERATPSVEDKNAAELSALNELYKAEGKTVPEGVSTLIKQGVSPMKADRAYREAEDKKIVAEKDAEIERLKQQLSAAEKAPVTGVANTGVKKEKKDDFLSGLTAENW